METSNTFYVIELFTIDENNGNVSQLQKVLIFTNEDEADTYVDTILDILSSNKNLRIIIHDNEASTSVYKNNKLCLYVHTFKTDNWKKENISTELQKLMDYNKEDDI